MTNTDLSTNPTWALSIVESANDAIITIDSSQKILLFNRRAEEMFMCPSVDAIGQSLDRFLPERFRNHHAAHVESFGKSAVTTRSMGAARPVSGLRANGKEFPVEASISQIEIDSQKLFTVIMRDISERKRSEEGRAYLAAIVESTDDAIISKTLDGNITAWNKGAEQLYGYTATEAIGHPVAMLVPKDRVDELQEILTTLKQGQRIRQLETIRTNKAGDRLHVSITVSPITDAEGTLIGASTIARDLTGRKRIEQQIVEQSELLDLVPAIVRDENDKITLWTTGAERLYGFFSEEALGKTPNELLNTQFPEPMEDIRAELLVAGKWEGELIQRRRDGKRITVVSQWTVRKETDSSALAILEVNTDLTEQRNIEAQLLRAQRMESIGTLAGGIAHDLNNILAPIMLSVDMLDMEVKSPAGKEFLSVLSSNAQRGSEMIRQVLSFARGVEGERHMLQPTVLVKEMVRVLKETLPKSIDIHSQLPQDSYLLSADPTQLHQLLMNLCINARDAMPHGGTLTIKVENTFIDENYARLNLEARSGNYVKISVSDTGTGIDPEITERIFEPFFSTKELGKGTGLGLSTALTIVKGHGGFINIYSEKDRGTQITIHLPASKSQSYEEITAKTRDLPSGNGELILIVDDEEAIRQITKSTLEAFGYKVMTATDGTDAMGIYAEHKSKVSVVITDMMMPFMDGVATIRALRKMNPDVRVISTSGLGDNAKAAEAAKAGVQRFLPKPYTTEQLLRALAEVIDM